MVLGSLDEDIDLTVYDVGCGVDVILGYPWLAAHDLQFLYESAAVSFCSEAGCLARGHQVRLDVAGAAPTPPSAATLMSSRELRRLLSGVGLVAAAPAARPTLWRPPPTHRGAAAATAALAAAAEELWLANTLAGLADGPGLSLDDVTVV